MKNWIKWTDKIILLAILPLIIFSGCAKKVTFLGSAVVPAAEGTVTIKEDNNKNYDIDLAVIRLADPGRLTPPRNVYVVWMETDQGQMNIGQLYTSTKGLSKRLTSSLKTVSPHKPTGFFITAEDDALGNYPGMTVVLRTAAIVYK
jgi:hypothetical protein